MELLILIRVVMEIDTHEGGNRERIHWISLGPREELNGKPQVQGDPVLGAYLIHQFRGILGVFEGRGRLVVRAMVVACLHYTRKSVESKKKRTPKGSNFARIYEHWNDVCGHQVPSNSQCTSEHSVPLTGQ